MYASWAGPKRVVLVLFLPAPFSSSIDFSLQPAADDTGIPTVADTGESMTMATVPVPPVPLVNDAFSCSTAFPECTGTVPARKGHAAETNGVTVTLSKPTVVGCTPSKNLLRKGVAPELHGWQYDGRDGAFWPTCITSAQSGSKSSKKHPCAMRVIGSQQ